MPLFATFVIAALAGTSFAVIGIAYRIGQPRRIAPAPILMFASICGVAFFLIRSGGIGSGAPARVWVLGAVAGLTQYLALKLLRLALAAGPFSPAWCAASLGFVPVVVWSSAFLHETMHVWQYLSVAAAVLSVVVACAGPSASDPAGGGEPHGLGRSLLYGTILLAVLLVNGVASIAMKDLGTHPAPGDASYMRQWAGLFMALLYFFIAAGVGAERLIQRTLDAPFLPTLALGLLAGLGSIGGMWGMSLVAQAKSSMPFPVSGVSQILAASLVSAIFFGEKVTGCWIGTIALGVAAVVLAPIGYAW